MDPAHLRTLSINSAISVASEREEERPVRCAKFRRQELKAFKPVWSPMAVAIHYFIVSLILIPLGVVVFTQSTKLLQTPLMRYDNPEGCVAETRNDALLRNASILPTNACDIKVNITQKTKGRVFIYYGLVNFYQNSRRYARSRSVDQLRGINNPFTDDCKPVRDPRVRGSKADPVTPCGLTAFSQFNDSFQFCRDRECSNSSTVNTTDKGIAWQVDRTSLFRSNPNNTDAENARITDENFMVWMRLSPYRTWFKLSKRVLEPLEPSVYIMRVNSTFPVQSFGGEKFIYLAETTWFGGPNKFLGLASIVVGALSLLLSIIYGLGSRFSPDFELPPETQVPWLDSSSESVNSNHSSRKS